jgi:hypothetical protein
MLCAAREGYSRSLCAVVSSPNLVHIRTVTQLCTDRQAVVEQLWEARASLRHAGVHDRCRLLQGWLRVVVLHHRWLCWCSLP